MITTVLLAYDPAEGDERIYEINRYFVDEPGFSRNLGTGHHLYYGKFEHFAEEDFCSYLQENFKWHYPQLVQLFAQAECEEEYRLSYPVYDHKLTHIECQHCFHRVR